MLARWHRYWRSLYFTEETKAIVLFWCQVGDYVVLIGSRILASFVVSQRRLTASERAFGVSDEREGAARRERVLRCPLSIYNEMMAYKNGFTYIT